METEVGFKILRDNCTNCVSAQVCVILERMKLQNLSGMNIPSINMETGKKVPVSLSFLLYNVIPRVCRHYMHKEEGGA